MNNMSNKNKIILVKSVIALCGFLMVLTIVAGFAFEFHLLEFISNEVMEKIYMIMFILCFISAPFMWYLMFKIDIRDEKVKPLKFKIDFNNYNIFKLNLYNSIHKNGYSDFEVFENDKFLIEYSIKKNLTAKKVICLLKCEEMTDEIYNDFKNNYFEDFGHYLLKQNKVNATDDISIIFVICVDRLNNKFNNYITDNVKQYFGRFNLPLGISFGSKTLYSPVQKGGLYKNKYNSLLKEFKTYVNLTEDSYIKSLE